MKMANNMQSDESALALTPSILGGLLGAAIVGFAFGEEVALALGFIAGFTVIAVIAGFYRTL